MYGQVLVYTGHCSLAYLNHLLPSLPLTGLSTESECTPCVGGMACDVQGMESPIRPCSPGYYCRLGANTTTPELGTNADVCPAGSYCPEMSTEPVPCPEGSYSPTPGLHTEEQCLNCTGGYYCNVTGLTSEVGQCDPRYYCPEGSHRIDEEICPIGYYCPLATQYPEPCRNGTWSNETGLMEVTECQPCTAGFYCNGFALTEPSGPCLEGYYCPTGSDLMTEVSGRVTSLVG